jgi:prevent-host-death family protein
VDEFKRIDFYWNKSIDSLTDFKRNTAKHVRRLKKSQGPLILTVNGKAEMVVMDARVFERLMHHVEQLETLDGIRRGLEDIDRGRTLPAKEALAAIRKRLKVPRSA